MTKHETRLSQRRLAQPGWGALVTKTLYALPAALIFMSMAASAQNLSAPPPLSDMPIPEPAALMNYVKDRGAAIQLGKALFWDMQVGSDGIQACASCHFHAGADQRYKNTVHPSADGAFSLVPGPNATISAALFPSHHLSNITDRLSGVISDSDDVVGSAGVFNTTFVAVNVGSPYETGTGVADTVFHVGTGASSHNVRRQTGRNAPSVINAVFNYANFWDGRANNIFNGASPWGQADASAKIYLSNTSGGPGTLVPTAIALENSSLASQAVGPPGNPTEMSYNLRTFMDIGKKMLSLRPLDLQQVHQSDSSLGSMTRQNGRWLRTGLNQNYTWMVQQAFLDKYWSNNNQVVNVSSTGVVTVINRPSRLAANQYTQMMANFSLFFGLSIQMYESTLVSDQTPFDKFQGGDRTAMTASAQEGMNLFYTPADQGFAGGSCFNCHAGPEFTKASVSNVGAQEIDTSEIEDVVERMELSSGEGAFYDSGYYNIGVRPQDEDVGRAGSTGMAGTTQYPLSFTARALMVNNGQTLPFPTPKLFCGAGQPTPCPLQRAAVNGAFKTPTLRNVELTGPFFHNGGQATLMQVVDFYSRGGDFHEYNIANLDSDIDTIDGMNETGKQHIVDFLLALTDDRVKWEKSPFDHPELFITNGSPGDSTSVTCTTLTCDSPLVRLPPIGLNGRLAEGLPALGTFLGLDQHAH
jgi:cytochrome c peroxidase